jgi:hypothetical protein
VNGQFEWYSTAADLLAYIRSDESQQILVMINLSDQTCEVPEPEGFTHVFGAQQPDVVEAFSFKIYEKIMQ